MIHCPNCNEKIDDPDWFYTRKLYNESRGREEKCPHCLDAFMIQAREMITYDVCTIEDFKEYGDFW